MRVAAAASVLLAALLVLVAAGGSPASAPGTGGRRSLLQPVDPSEVVPASLSRGAVVNWAIAARTLQQAADRLTACGTTPRCVQRRTAAFTAQAQSALADARMLEGANGACGQAFGSYAAEVNRYAIVASELAGATHPTPGMARSLAHTRGAITYAVMLVWHYCRRGV
jgi:hypothetical protein